MLKALITCPALKKQIMINLLYHTCFNKKKKKIE
jgi:hypothetical protein